MNTKLITKTKYMGAVITLMGLFIFFAVPVDMFTSTVFSLDTDIYHDTINDERIKPAITSYAAVSAPGGGEGVDYIYNPPELYGYEEDSCSETEGSDLVSLSVIENFAPQLRFDHNAGTFPMSAQEYFENAIEGPFSFGSNEDVATLTTPGLYPPTYYKAFMVGNQIRIMYWWFYGYQPGCYTAADIFCMFLAGDHHGDWERVMVILSEDQSSVAAVTFWQHKGWYTRLAENADMAKETPDTSFGDGLEFDGTHPVIYVGKNQHGSYFNQGGNYGAHVCYRWPACGYFDDFRNNEDNLAYRLDTWSNLVSLSDQAEPWMLESALDNYLQIGTGDGITTIFNLDSKYVLANSVNIWVDDILLNVNAWSFSDGTGINGKDQIVLNFAPYAGALITALYDKGDFTWGPGGEEGVYGHPIHISTLENVRALVACWGYTDPNFGTAGCYHSQCRYLDNHVDYNCCTGKEFPGRCIAPDQNYYEIDSPIPQCDHGLCQPLYDHFSDIPISHWAHLHIYEIFLRGITTGCTATTYCPANNVTRAQMATFIIRAVEGEPANDYCGTTDPFNDVPYTHWACKYIKRLSERGITEGCGNNNYCPNNNVNRAQMAIFIIRALYGDDFIYSSTPYFPDVPSGHWAFKYIQKLYEEGITTGYDDGTYKPLREVNRAQMAVFLARAFLGME
ncbi:MAG: S-layer homology domain-containing protein [Planctomycetota bacterium]